MGLELTPEIIAANMPEYCAQNVSQVFLKFMRLKIKILMVIFLSDASCTKAGLFRSAS